MALIKCVECEKEVSTEAAICPNCGYPISKMSTVGIVKIKIPRTEQISGGWVGLFSSKSTSISSNGIILWSGKHGETATFKVNGVTKITINLGFWGNSVEGIVCPHKRYQLIMDYGFHMKATFRLSEIDIIDAD